MDSRRRPRGLKVATLGLACAPLARLAGDAAFGRLGANPVSAIENRLGWWALVMLLASLACTPLNLTLRWSWPLRLRRMLGLSAFCYATLHLATYLVVDQGLSVRDILDDVEKRRFITVGAAAWLLLVPLAVTSTAGWTRRLGGARWKALHRLVYLVAALGLLHFAWRFKVLEDEPVLFASLFALLLLVRVAHALGRRARAQTARENARLGVSAR